MKIQKMIIWFQNAYGLLYTNCFGLHTKNDSYVTSFGDYNWFGGCRQSIWCLNWGHSLKIKRGSNLVCAHLHIEPQTMLIQ